MRIFLSILLVFAFAFSAWSQEVQQKIPDRTRILFLLDGSGSMLAGWSDTNRITAAKNLLTSLVDSLKGTPEVELALRAYGHLYARSSQNCKDTKLEVGFGPSNHQRIIQRLAQIEPKGTTPIAYSLEQAAGDFPSTEGYRNIIIIITDGIESCDGDPCEVSLALQRKGIFLRPFVIGIGMNEEFAAQFNCLGTYFDAREIDDFKTALNEAIRTSLEPATVSVELLDEQGRPRETNLNVSFINSLTRASEFDFVHYRDTRGRPDSVTIDPVLTYDVIANSVPPVIKRNVRIEPGRHNVISLTVPRGKLSVMQSGAGVYGENPKALVREKGGRSILYAQQVNTTHDYLSGTYDLEVLTLPRTMLRNVEVRPRETTTLRLPSPGILNIQHAAAGYGSLYVVREDGSQEWVMDLNHNDTKISIALQPGRYKVVFRASMAPGSKYTSIKDVEVKEGQSQLIRIF